jgi:7-keto-8-aminopelargonate synthetase-like enzyme
MSLPLDPPTLAEHFGAWLRLTDGTVIDNYCGYNYLNLQFHPAVRQAVAAAVRAYGMTGMVAGGIRHPIRQLLEEELLALSGAEAVLVYPSNYMGAQILLSVLLDRCDVILVDAETHYSAQDALCAARVPVVPFRHRDADALREAAGRLKPGQRPLLITDGVFPVTGAIAPLDAYAEILAHCSGRQFCIDDAHAMGILGARGRGTLEHFGLEGQPGFYVSATLSKALGGHGGFIAGSASLIAELHQKSRIPRGASPVSVPNMAAAARALQVLRDEPDLRPNLQRNIARAQAGLRSLGLTIADIPIPIISFTMPGADACQQIGDDLQKQGILVRVFGPREYSSAPDVPCIRIALSTCHTSAQIDRLVQAIGACIARQGLPVA